MRALAVVLVICTLGACGDDSSASQQDGGLVVDAALAIDGATVDSAPALEFVIDNAVVDWHNPSIEASIHFGPESDIEAKVLAQLEAAQTRIHVAFFNLNLDSIKSVLVAKMNAGLDVHVLLDSKQQSLSYNTMAAELDAAGVTVTEITNASATDAVMNNRFMILDDAIVLTGSAALTSFSVDLNDEDLAVLRSTALAARYETEFLELIAGTEVDSQPYANGTPIRALMGPEDSLLPTLVGVIDSAQTHVLVALRALNNSSIVDALTGAHDRGVKVIVVLDAVQAGLVGETADETLIAAGVAVVLAASSANPVTGMRSGFVVVDHQTVVLGSYVWTNLSSFFNDENILVIDDSDLADRADGKFAALIDTYSSVTASVLGLTTGAQAVTFSVSNVTLDPGLTLKIKSIGGGPFDTPLDLTNFSVTSSLPSGTSIEYLYEIHGPAGVVYTETTTRHFTVPYASGPFALSEALRL